jgi:hypothetical protein
LEPTAQLPDPLPHPPNAHAQLAAAAVQCRQDVIGDSFAIVGHFQTNNSLLPADSNTRRIAPRVAEYIRKALLYDPKKRSLHDFGKPLLAN